MPLILSIETSSPCCSVCLSNNGDVVGLNEIIENANHASILTVMIDDLMKEHMVELNELDAIAVSAGPGSYTGLRIGAATAKGLCYALSKPLIAIDSLQVLAYGMYSNHPSESFLYCSTVDARRNEIYYGIFGKEAITIEPSANIILHDAFLHDYLEKGTIIIGGSGAAKCQNFLGNHAIQYDTKTFLSAKWMIALAEMKWKEIAFEDPVSFEPNYVKPAFIIENNKGKITG